MNRTSLGLQLDDAHVKPFVEDNRRRQGDIGRGYDLCDALIERAFEDGLCCVIGGMSGSEPQFYRLVLEAFADLCSHLIR